MAKSKRPAAVAKKLAKLNIAFAGKFGYAAALEYMKAEVKHEGGTVVDGEKIEPDYLVVGTGVGGNSQGAAAKILKKFPAVKELDEAGFSALLIPTEAEMVELMTAGIEDHDFWQRIQHRFFKSQSKLDLSDRDFRKLTVTGTFYGATLDRGDFRGAKLFLAYFDKVVGAKFDGATFDDGSFSKAEDCSLKEVTMTDVRWNPAEFTNCNFTGSKLDIRVGSYTSATDCYFAKVDFTGADLDQSRFLRCDFRSVDFRRAKLAKCNFIDAKLAGANFEGADLRNATFPNADLSKANFRNAILSGADFTGAKISGANFDGAITTGANFAGIDTKKAKNLVLVAARSAGPNIRELAKVAGASKKFSATIELGLGTNEWVVLYPSMMSYGGRQYFHGQYNHQSPNTSEGNYVDAPSFEQAMLNLADRWSRGTPKFDSVKIEAKQCPMKGAELKSLAINAWHEALGLAVPSADDLQTQLDTLKTADGELRETLIAELSAGPKGVKKWNARSEKERSKLGKLRNHDFRNAHLAGLRLDQQDLEGSNFESANLTRAYLESTQLKGACFAQSSLHDGSFANSKCTEANFEKATITKCNLRAASFRRANFRGANLTKSDFSYSDLCGADFTGATLDGVEFCQTKFDEKTIFPPGFVPPEGLIWRGIGPRPGTAPPAPQPSGSLDFDAFLAALNLKVDLGRMKKAGSMLKAEKFELFSDVKSESVVGVVKSQTSKDLVYSCRLAADGAFSCCTQNLRPCGGLQGALCKHLLVLIVGLAKAGQLDPATVDHWVDASRGQKPAIDTDLMSETFLRYKGAEAGEIDWRPTETLPEDFYAM